MKCTNFLRFIEKPDEGDMKAFSLIEEQAKESISSISRCEDYVQQIIALFHDAFNSDQVAFVRDIFFQNQLVIRNTQEHQEFIFDSFQRAKALNPGRRKQIELVNVYRSVVADLFDPYLSILLACIHLTEGTFKSFEVANLGSGERQKFEFVKARFPNSNLFDGYYPVIRNAISHTGSHGLIYSDDYIVFRNVKRGQQPAIDCVKKITTQELEEYIQQLIDFTQSVDVAINIIGIDLKEVIGLNVALKQSFMKTFLTQDQLKEMRESFESEYLKVLNDSNLSNERKQEYFIRLFAEGCQENNIDAKTIRFKNDFVIIQTPLKKPTTSDKSLIINRAIDLIRIALFAEPFFNLLVKEILVEEINELDSEPFQIWLSCQHIKLYNEGKCNMYDLLYDGKLFKAYTHQPVVVNFDAVDDLELKSIKGQRKRRMRENE